MSSDAFALSDVGRVAVGSTNPVKVAAVRAVLARVRPEIVVESIFVASDVPEQPWGDEETIRGARTRAERALAATDAELGVGLEGGLVEQGDGSLRTCAWAVVASLDGGVSIGGSLAMPLPPAVAAAVRDGLELGHAMDRVTRGQNTKHNAGAVGILTAGLIDRQRAYEAILTYALAPWLSADLWGEPGD